MAAGRYGGYRDREFRDLEASRSKDHCDLRRERDRGGLRDRLRFRLGGDIKEPEAANGSHRHHTVGGGAGSRFARRAAADREPGELSSGSGSDDPEEVVSFPVKNSPLKPENGALRSLRSPSKKRKFSPIIWDRDDSVSGSPRRRNELLPPPSLLQGFVSLNSVDAARRAADPVFPLVDAVRQAADPASPSVDAVRRAADVASLVDVEASINSPHESDPEPRQVEIEEDTDFAPTRHISSSRWADGNDEDAAFDEEIVPRRRKNTPLPDPTELGEVVVREGSEEGMHKSSGSGGEQLHDYHEMEVVKNDYMDVDGGDDDHYGVNDLSDIESDLEDDRAKTPEPFQPPHRCIDMLHGCRSVDEFERLNKIDEGTYGVVYRAKDRKTGEIVALKKVKMEKEREGFPMTSLREINILLSFHHPSIVDVKEVVVGSSLDSIFMVMEYMEHDLKGLMEMMKQSYSQSEVKCLMLQLFEGVKYLHDNWVLHRDLKTSNLLLNNRGELKICDFGLSRQYGIPLKPYTHLVVTLWYRAPELLLGAKEYSTAIDMWSLGCIMAELLAKEPLFNGKTEFDQLDKIFRTLGTPSENIWPGFVKLPGVKVNFVKQPYNRLREKFPPTSFLGRPTLSESGFDLLNKLLTYDPEKRITAEAALNHAWFREVPLPKSKDFMPTFPAQHAQDRRLRRIMKSPDPLEEQRRKELQQGELGTGGLFG